ncbi:MAG: hypothetical protein NXY57DRAFT_905541 [Lentinula lateritia]|uniref:Uncharacterized protein n=1 Tax=Lentinula lateritia TaxID=40482 RepID=A0ABQ8VN67_9AGAR|nr:MAG: hypothetical protein NXY57DRAFT_905541 [Lentinula lateritia]KAJ4497351.1 hypothetical protein C8R41DRAFT_760001 [Lentinula lateritia]
MTQDERYNKFCDCLIEIAQVVPTNHTAGHLNALQIHVLNNLDRNCPFRELATSRLKVQQADGLFDHHQINTREGIFSGLIFRGILFNTPTLRELDNGGFFDSWEAWKQFVLHHEQKGDDYLCNKSAFGRTNGRSHHNAHRFWIASAKLHAKLQEPSITFTQIIDYIANTKGDDSKSLFVTFGVLSAYLFAVDLVYAGCIPHPSLQEIAAIIPKLDKGALHGLLNLGFASSSSEVEIVPAFITLFHRLDCDQKLLPIKKQIGFDFFMLEHSLCKLSRDQWLERY